MQVSDATQTSIGRSTKAQYTKKAIVFKGHEWSLSNESAGENVQEAPREIGTSDLMVDEWTVGVFSYD